MHYGFPFCWALCSAPCIVHTQGCFGTWQRAPHQCPRPSASWGIQPFLCLLHFLLMSPNNCQLPISLGRCGTQSVLLATPLFPSTFAIPNSLLLCLSLAAVRLGSLVQPPWLSLCPCPWPLPPCSLMRLALLPKEGFWGGCCGRAPCLVAPPGPSRDPFNPTVGSPGQRLLQGLQQGPC